MKKSRKFVVKIVRTQRERRFYKKRVEHPNIIQPEEVFNAVDWDLVVLPELVPLSIVFEVNRSFKLDSKMSGKFLDMSNDLANRLQFLHDSGVAHMDIKPHNLVYHPKTFVLQIIDFNSAVWIKNPEETRSSRYLLLDGAWFVHSLRSSY
ncbi:kinase-like domain-containing protein [Rhodocollybia butyracea]|uniref:Kinase-like domain-containing protein n=1 Tax=Rhodocollybia butyracea TaxID=206335 RepID=A0A9P5Q143_9AGAR|nr:kinase-like domain-containing protein [Rhodocollybia butyracea]